MLGLLSENFWEEISLFHFSFYFGFAYAAKTGNTCNKNTKGLERLNKARKGRVPSSDIGLLLN